MRSATRKLADLVIDQNLFPRSRVDEDHISSIRAAMRGGAEFPPIVVDQKNRIIDGRHRHRAWIDERGEDFCITVHVKHYDDDRAAFIDALRLNAKHGKPLTKTDRGTIVSRATKNRVSLRAIAAALGMKWQEFKGIAEGRVATVQHVYPEPIVSDDEPKIEPEVERVIIKKTIGHMAGKELTPAQVAANQQLNGWQQNVYVDQMILLIESGLLNTGNPELMAKVQKLHGLLDDLFASGSTNGKTVEALATAGA